VRRLLVASGVLACFVGLPENAQAADIERPIVAVFPIQPSGINLGADVVDRLSDYLATGIATTGRFSIVPQFELKSLLTQQKRLSFKECYLPACQIELGRELAAQKSLSTKIMRLGSGCIVTSVFYDLREAASERGARAKGACTEDGIVSTIDAVIAKLTIGHDARSKIEPRCAVQPTVVANKPPVAKRSAMPLMLRRQRMPTTTKAQPFDRLAFATRTEWLSLDFNGGFATGTGGLGGAALRLFNIKWKKFFWQIVDIGGAGAHDGFFGHAGTILGYPLYLGSKGQHQFKFGAGPEVTGTGNGIGVALMPFINYQYHTAGRTFMGGSLRTFIPLHPEAAFAISLGFTIGWSSAI